MQLLSALLFVCALPAAVPAQMLRGYVILHNFIGQANPMAPLVEGPDGSFYGVTPFGTGSDWRGTVFKVTTNGAFATLVAFTGANGQDPGAGLGLGSDGNFYGTSSHGRGRALRTSFQVTVNSRLRALSALHHFDGPCSSD